MAAIKAMLRILNTGISRRLVLMVGLLLFMGSATTPLFAQSSVRPPENAVNQELPSNLLGEQSDSDIWRAVRHGAEGTVSIPDPRAGTLVQSAGENWRLIRNGPLPEYSAYAMAGTVVLLALFFAFRGRIRIEAGRSGMTITRFSAIERLGHWLMAISFIILGITGLNITFGREFILPLMGKEAFAAMSGFFKLSHNYVAFAFIAGLVIAFVFWVMHNFPSRTDLKWIARGGGMIGKHNHPPAKKFNAGQKIIFWLVMIGGLSLVMSGWALLFPFEYHFFSDTFALLSRIGIDVPALLGIAEPPYTVIQEQQFNSVWHMLMAAFMICVILAHIYIGTIGMEGAFEAMGSGEVDLNWAKEHHSLWVAKEIEKQRRKTAPPATVPGRTKPTEPFPAPAPAE